jgi:hypothetical protein
VEWGGAAEGGADDTEEALGILRAGGHFDFESHDTHAQQISVVIAGTRSGIKSSFNLFWGLINHTE